MSSKAATSCVAVPNPLVSSSNPDVIIVGAGASGYLVARRFAELGKSCVLLEAGPLLPKRLPRTLAPFNAAVDPYTQFSATDSPYESCGVPFEWTRVRAAGGRTLSWGGWCDPLLPHHLRDARALGAPWPLQHADLAPHVHRVEKTLNVKSARLLPQFKKVARDLDLRITGKRCALNPENWRATIAQDWCPTAVVHPHAMADQVLLDDQQRVQGVQVRDMQSGERYPMYAPRVILCASPIESARILQRSDITKTTQRNIGKGLTDHMVASMLVIMPEPVTCHGRNAPHPLDAMAVIPRFVNLDRKSQRDYVSGFSVEIKGPLPMMWIGREGLNAMDLDTREAKQLSFYMIHAIGEVGPSEKRYLRFHRKKRDAWGRAVPVIHWQWTPAERHMARDMMETCEAVARSLASAGSRILLTRDPLQDAGAGHEASVCRMGRDPECAVTSPYGAVHGTRGLFVADASIMPTALDCHPTIPMLGLALRVANFCAGQLK